MAGDRGRDAMADWLRAEHLPVDEADARLQADREILADLTAARFQGELWNEFVDVLARYGLAVIRGWLRTRQIRAKCQGRGLAAPDLPLHVTDDPVAAGSIANEVVARAIVKFRDDVLAKGKWNPDRPGRVASLKTFFIGQCLIQYPNAARAWLTEQEQAPALLREDELAIAAPLALEPATETAIRDVTASALQHGATNERAARILALDSLGYSRKDIAAELGSSPDSVASILKRERARLRRTMVDPRRESSA